MEKIPVITALGDSPEQERRSRMVKYTVAMTIRVICIVLAMFVQGWLMWVAFAGAILLPYFAVVLANAQESKANNLSRVKPVVERITVDLRSSENSN